MNSCRIQGNLGDFGAVLNFSVSDGNLRNTVIHGNESLQNYGAVFVHSGDLALTHCSVVDNRAGLSGGGLVAGTGATLNATNSILWNAAEEITDLNAADISVSHTCVRGGYAGDGNFDARPAFWNIVTGDLRQHPDSSCVNVSGVPVVLETDIDGNVRPLDGAVDLGAFETAQLDTDGDGLLDGFETAWSGTDPENPNSDNYGLWDGDTWFKRRPWLVNPLATAEVPDGYRWDTAFSTIQEAIDVAAIHGGGDVWVMAGTYRGEGPRVIYVRDNVSVYGGFDGTEWRVSQRQPDVNPVILDGERDRQVAHLLGQTRLDGLTIMNGFGIDGAGVYGWHERVDLHNCDFVQNRAISRGAGAFINSRTLEIKDCTFVDNTATQSGGGLWTGAFFGRVENTVFTGNRSIREGSAISTHYTGTHFVHCTIAGNVARTGVSAVYSISSGFERMANCILYDNGENIVNALTNETLWVQHSIVQGGYDGIEILNVPPQFLDLAGRDFRLAATSPALDRGATFFGLPRDILGTSRPQGAGYDLGAYERPVNGFGEEALPVVVVADTRRPETEVADGEPVLEVRFAGDTADSTERDASPERAVTMQSVHDADVDGDRALSVEELLRVVQLYHAQGVRCGDATEDGFAPGAGRVDCAPHHLDYDPQDWVIGLDELLRAIAFYNGGGPYPCPNGGTEDGWCSVM
jgi:hypothetical protein